MYRLRYCAGRPSSADHRPIDAVKEAARQKRELISAESSDFYRKLLRISDCAATFTSEVRRMSDGTLSREPKLKLVAGGGVRTLEDVIRELLQPILQEWLDDKLPEIIERLVRSEMARVLHDVAA
jgi:cell pole-organizing protein PopZ